MNWVPEQRILPTKDVLGGEGRLVDVDGPNLKVALLAGGDCVAAIAAERGGGMPLKAAKALAALDVPYFDGPLAGGRKSVLPALVQTHAEDLGAVSADAPNELSGVEAPKLKVRIARAEHEAAVVADTDGSDPAVVAFEGAQALPAP